MLESHCDELGFQATWWEWMPAFRSGCGDGYLVYLAQDLIGV